MVEIPPEKRVEGCLLNHEHVDDVKATLEIIQTCHKCVDDSCPCKEYIKEENSKHKKC